MSRNAAGLYSSQAASSAPAGSRSTTASSCARQLAVEAALVVLGNTGIALFLTAASEYGFLENLVYSQGIGLAIFTAIRGLAWLFGLDKPTFAVAAAGIPLGALAGFALATWANGLTLAGVLQDHPRTVLIAGAAALLFGSVATYLFFAQARLVEAKAEAEQQRLRRLAQESLSAQTELKLLQAQIEPHFLFNTLSNVVGLIDADPAAAREMLLHLTALLRTSLARTRREAVALAEELELLRAYLSIMAIRMGPRLAWSIEADPAVLAARLPPLLVQPLVENAIRHGLEPKVAGGRLVIRCTGLGGFLEIVVEDDGRGFGGHAETAGGAEAGMPSGADVYGVRYGAGVSGGTAAAAPRQGGGLGLANIRERLAACYGAAASLTLAANPAGGATARLTLPWSDHAPSDR